MASVNKVIIVGNLGKDPETRTFPSGDMIANVNVATTDKWKDKESGEMKEATEWHRVIFNGRLAEIASEYLTKGSQVYIEGSLRTRKYTDNAGVEKYTTEIRADRLQMLSKREGGDQDQGGGQQRQQPQRQQAQGQRNSAPARGNGGQQRAPARQATGGSGGWDDMGDENIPFIDPLKRRGFHLVV